MKIGIQPDIEAYIQALVLRKTLESLSFDRRKGLEEETFQEEPKEMRKRVTDVCGYNKSLTA
ncbi:hypothetical protein BDAP_000869 [Binucleata daphniae]